MAASASDALRSPPRSPLWSTLEGRDGTETRVHADRHHRSRQVPDRGRTARWRQVACFLLEMSDRLAEGEAIELPMSRQDIADYLGLTIETVSRTMTQLVSDRTIGLPSSRRIVLRNRSVLHELNS